MSACSQKVQSKNPLHLGRTVVRRARRTRIKCEQWEDRITGGIIWVIVIGGAIEEEALET